MSLYVLWTYLMDSHIDDYRVAEYDRDDKSVFVFQDSLALELLE